MEPKIKIKGFDGEWSSKSLYDLGFMTAGGTPSTFIKEYWNGNINWLQSGAIQNNVIDEKAVVKKMVEMFSRRIAGSENKNTETTVSVSCYSSQNSSSRVLPRALQMARHSLMVGL